MLQSQTTLPEGVGQEMEPVRELQLGLHRKQTDCFISQWPYANHRCMYACENMAAKIRRMEEAELESCSPCLVLPIFAAARFYIGMALLILCLLVVSLLIHSLILICNFSSYKVPARRRLSEPPLARVQPTHLQSSLASGEDVRVCNPYSCRRTPDPSSAVGVAD